MRRDRRDRNFTRFSWAAVVVLAVVFWAGCGTDPPDADPGCSTDSDCSEGHYCDSDKSCRQDCKPGTGQAECGGSKACTERGRCMEITCESDDGCPDRLHCDDGTCAQDCNPSDGSACGTGERCTERGRCEIVGECTKDSDCEDPPAPTCVDGSARRPQPNGSCEMSGGESTCSYPAETQSCQYGCSDGECLPNPCDGKSCNAPPAAECSSDGTELITYQTPGTCQPDEDGICEYQKMRSSCANGCSNGSCDAAACDTVTCDDPPEDTCDDNVVVSYADTGTCEETMNGTQCDYSPGFQHCSYSGATCQSASCKDPVTQVGGIVITEYMANPAARVDRAGEWFEIRNVGSSTVDLRGWQLVSDGETPHPIGASLSIGPGERRVLAVDDDPAGDGSITPDYVYDNLALANSSDWIRIKNSDGDIVDHVFWETGSILSGRSRKLDPDVTATVTANDDYENWCPSLESSEALSNGEEWGTPGSPNQPCASMPCSKFTCERPEPFCKNGDAIRPTKQNASCTESRFNNPNCDFGVQTFNCTTNELCAKGYCETIPSNVPGKGDVVITELMGDPDAVSDSKGEWIELYNTTSNKLSLFSIVIEDTESGGAKDSHTVLNKNAEIPANDYAVFAVNTDAAENGGVQNAYHYKGSHLKNSPGGLKIQLVRQDGTIVDSSYYGEPTTGVSQQLSLASYEQGASDPDGANDQADNWCDADSTYGDGDKGTPGADNRTCP